MTKEGVEGYQVEDKWSMVYCVFVWLGIGTLLPWNFYITVSSYWNFKYRSVNETYDDYQAGLKAIENNDTAFQPTFNDMMTNWGWQMTIAAMVPNVTFLLLNAAFGHRFRTQPRLLVSLILVIVLFAFTAAMAMIDTDLWQKEFLYLTLVTVVLINVNGAIFQSGLLGVAGKFPPKYMGGVFSGQAVGGVFASVTNVVMIASGADPVYAAFFCFLFAVAFLTLALVLYLWLTKSEFFHHYLGERSEVIGAKEMEKVVEEERLTSDGPHPPPIKVTIPTKVNPLLVLKQISLYAVTVYLIFACTLSCFPAITMLVVSVNPGHPDWAGKYFIPVCCFVLFNVGDCVGRVVAERAQWPRPGKAGMIIVFTLSVLRFSFIPLFLLCNAKPNERVNTPAYFESDAAYIAIMAAFSITNGYLSNVSMISAPQVVHQDQEKPTAAAIMVAFLGLGLGSGALLSSAVVALL